jgi:Fur family iron response transcriptional regulator
VALATLLWATAATGTSPPKLHHAARRSGEGVSLATVYNTLRAFCEAGLMREITVDGSKSYFDTNMTDHPHFFWEDECRLTDAPASELEIRRLPEAPEGAEIAAVDVVIRLRRV